MYVSTGQSLLALYLGNKFLCWVFGDDWIGKFTKWTIIVFIALSPVMAWRFIHDERERDKKVALDLYINARNNRIRSTTPRDEWGNFDFSDPSW